MCFQNANKEEIQNLKCHRGEILKDVLSSFIVLCLVLPVGVSLVQISDLLMVVHTPEDVLKSVSVINSYTTKTGK